MKAYVITIWDMERSVEVADRCVASAAKFGVMVRRCPAFTPADDPKALMENRGFDVSHFLDNPHSRELPCIATFLTHSALWAWCADDTEPYLILEHDAVFQAPIPRLPTKGLVNLGKPSFGTFETPSKGLGVLKSKPWMPGAHAYYLAPEAAQKLLKKAKTEACPTDVFLRLSRFPWLQEYYPWPIVCRDSFTTIQKEAGCVAKHNKVEIVGDD